MIAKRRPSGLAPPSWISRLPQNYNKQPKLLSSVSAMVTSNLAISNRPHQNISRRTSQKVTTLHGICSNIKKVIQVQIHVAGQIHRFPDQVWLMLMTPSLKSPLSEPLAHKGQILSLKSFSTHQEKTHE